MKLTYNLIMDFFYNLLITLTSNVKHVGCMGIKYIGHLTKKTFGYCDRHRIIKDKHTQEAYLERYYLLLKDRQTFPFNIFIHKFLKSDPDDLHDHPWPYFTCILKGGYFEHTVLGKFWRSPLTCRCGKATDLHRIELDPDVGDCWTLFIPGKKEREWGFIKQDGSWVEHQEYIKEKNN